MNTPSPLAVALVGLINSQSRSPTAQEIDNLISRHRSLTTDTYNTLLLNAAFAIEHIGEDVIYIFTKKDANGERDVERVVAGEVDKAWTPTKAALQAMAIVCEDVLRVLSEMPESKT